MASALQPDPPNQPPLRGKSSWLSVLVAVALLCVLAAAFYRWQVRNEHARTSTTQSQMSFGPEEQRYARNIHIGNLSMSRAENFLHQEVTTLSGEVVNGGNRPLKDIQVTIEFSDDLGQVILLEARSLFGGMAPPLQPGEHREFEISFDHVPSSWTMQQPAVRITGLQFAPAK